MRRSKRRLLAGSALAVGILAATSVPASAATTASFSAGVLTGTAVANGITEFIAGTGGANHTSLATRQPNSVVFNATTFGVLQLTLHATSYDWKFIPDTGSGSFTDSGSASCH